MARPLASFLLCFGAASFSLAATSSDWISPIIQSKIHSLRTIGLTVGFADSPPFGHRRQWSRYELAVFTHASLQELRFTLGLDSAIICKSTKPSLDAMARSFEILDELESYFANELEVIGLKRERAGQQLDEVASALEARGAVPVRFRDFRFPDVPKGHWADEAVHNLRQAGILFGYPNGRFKGS